MNLAAANKIAVPPNCPSRSFARAPPEALGPCCSAPPASPIVVVLPAPDRGPPEQRRAGACELAPNLQSVEGAGRSQRCLVQLRFARKISAGRETPPGFAATPRPGAGGHAPQRSPRSPGPCRRGPRGYWRPLGPCLRPRAPAHKGARAGCRRATCHARARVTRARRRRGTPPRAARAEPAPPCSSRLTAWIFERRRVGAARARAGGLAAYSRRPRSPGAQPPSFGGRGGEMSEGIEGSCS